MRRPRRATQRGDRVHHVRILGAPLIGLAATLGPAGHELDVLDRERAQQHALQGAEAVQAQADERQRVEDEDQLQQLRRAAGDEDVEPGRRPDRRDARDPHQGQPQAQHEAASHGRGGDLDGEERPVPKETGGGVGREVGQPLLHTVPGRGGPGGRHAQHEHDGHLGGNTQQRAYSVLTAAETSMSLSILYLAKIAFCLPSACMTSSPSRMACNRSMLPFLTAAPMLNPVMIL